MIRVFAHDNIMVVYNLRNLLERAGIRCEIRNDMTCSAAGEVPPIEVWPEIRVEPMMVSKAEAIVAEVIHGPSKETSWLCPKCSEDNAPAFELCWQCGHERER